MPWWSGVLFLAILCLESGVRSQSWQPSPLFDQGGFKTNKNQLPNNPAIDIQFDSDPAELLSDASGYGGFPSDDEDLGTSGSGSGSGFGIEIDEGGDDKLTPFTRTTPTKPAMWNSTTTTTSRPLSDCEIDQRRSQMLQKKGPDCDRDGSYSVVQCAETPGRSDCWCVDMTNGEIHGTRQEAPLIPSCEDGDNLSPCVFELVKAYRPHRLGSYKPRCTKDGQYEKVQCRGSICYCADEFNGRKIMGTEVSLPDRPNCDEKTEEPVVPIYTDEKKTDPDDGIDLPEPVEGSDDEDTVTLRPPYENQNVDGGKTEGGTKKPEIVFPDGPDSENVNIDSEGDGDADPAKPDETNETGFNKQTEIGKQGDADTKNSVQTAGEIMTQPGILAAIIGGAVVLLLCIVLLIMFIVYRMRKKDEGSYPLDEPRRPANYAYVRTPDREFYA